MCRKVNMCTFIKKCHVKGFCFYFFIKKKNPSVCSCCCPSCRILEPMMAHRSKSLRTPDSENCMQHNSVVFQIILYYGILKLIFKSYLNVRSDQSSLTRITLQFVESSMLTCEAHRWRCFTRVVSF